MRAHRSHAKAARSRVKVVTLKVKRIKRHR
jgi:hypothetical protein